MEQEEKKKSCSCEKECSCKTQDHKGHDKKKKEASKWQEKIEVLEQEKKTLEEKVQYTQAELVNFRRRKEEETQTRLKYANQDLILELLPILDNFERAIKLDDTNLNDELSKFLSGFKMMYAQMVDILKSFGVEEIRCQGEVFDPVTSEALLVESDPTCDDNTVLEVLLKGYRLKDRVIRPSGVKVNKLDHKKEELEKGEDNNE